tara:strand:+ start:356 stop:958 length:603 start_codon:yes stop_codon:yes gene_type:complete
MGIFDKIKKFTDGMDKKVENLDDSIKKLDEKLKTDEPTESVEETSSNELKELEELKDAGILTEEEFQQKKEEILSLESTSSQIEEETTPDKIVCDICGDRDWDEKSELHNPFKQDDFNIGDIKLNEIYLEFDDDYDNRVGLWCNPCKETIEMDIIEMLSYYYEDNGENKIIVSEEGFDYINESKDLLLDNVIMRSRGELD